MAMLKILRWPLDLLTALLLLALFGLPLCGCVGAAPVAFAPPVAPPTLVPLAVLPVEANAGPVVQVCGCAIAVGNKK